MFEGYIKATFTDYKNEVLNTYRRDGIKIGLEDPRPKKLREYSLYVYANRFSKEDEQTLKLFFDQDNKYNDLEKAIKSIELDKIKPLIRFMNGATKETEDKNVKLLAWLINFESYDAWRKNKQDMEKAPVESELRRQEVEHSGTFAEIEKDKNTSSAEDKNKDDEQELAEVEKRPLPISQLKETSKPSPPKPAYKQWVLYTVITSVTAIGIYFALHRNPGCMFWSGDHYQPVSCKEKIQDVTIIALDESKVDRFRKITRPDTLTERALGKVWYVKMTIDSLEFYTAGGFHPIYTSKKLKPLTDYILERHIQYKQPADSLGK